MPNDDDDDAVRIELHVKQQGRPNAYWERVRKEQEKDDRPSADPDTFGGGYRGVPPSPHGGAATVHPEDILGADELCWCGRPAGHHWPGKSVGAKHPKGMDMVKEMTATIDRRDLRGYHRVLQDFLMQCINDDGLRFRIARNSIVLYPPDGSQPATVYCRNTDRQIRQLAKWYMNHVREESGEPEEEESAEPATEEQIEALAKAKNDPVEHPQKETPEYQDTPADPAEYLPPKAAELPGDPEPPGKPPVAPPLESEWVPHILRYRRPGDPDDGQPRESENIETNGTLFRCKWCMNTDHPLLTDKARSIGGHNRIWHTDTTNLYDQETRAKATETIRVNKITGQVNEAIELLMGAIGQTRDTGEVKELQAANDRLNSENKKLTKELSDLRAEHEEVQAKLALLRETLNL